MIAIKPTVQKDRRRPGQVEVDVSQGFRGFYLRPSRCGCQGVKGQGTKRYKTPVFFSSTEITVNLAGRYQKSAPF